ncbi:hypothetical protein BDZ97DRAFT_1814885 [Flammula alnicola]|nr:hypothetical protein BDZ97DRAFT_1814885 [Flammula alnicola]
MLDWDNTSIVFTKRTLIEFLKYTGTTVDTNFSTIGKLPRYAKFGKLSETAANVTENVADSDPSSAPANKFIPSRRVRTAPGGPQTDIFANLALDDEGDALSHAPPKAQTNVPSKSTAPTTATQTTEEEEPEEVGINFPSSSKPTRRVRENPGGNSSLSNFWDAEEPTEFKPTRRVRQGPGGHDSISDIF